MAFKGSFNISVCEEDFDYENMHEDGPSKDSFRFLTESEASVQRRPETIEIGVFSERTDSDSTSDSEITEEISSLQRHKWSAATQKMLSSMPSRKAGLQSSAGISVRARQPKPQQLQQKSLHPSRGNQAVELEEISHEDAVNKFLGSGYYEDDKEQLVSTLQGLSVSEGLQKLRAMPLCLADKKRIRQIAFSSVAESSLIRRKIPCSSCPCACISRTCRHCALRTLPVLSSLKLWSSALKRLRGRYGTGVLSYFLFLRTLLFINLLLFIIISLFLVIPQAIHPPPSKSFQLNPLGVLTGTGNISESLMFYGYYSNTTCQNCDSDMSYSIPKAYFYSIAISFFVICIILVYSLSKSFGKSFQVLKSNMNLSEKVFCSWDFKVSKKSSVQHQSEKISTQLKEQLSELMSGEERKSCMQLFCSLLVHVISWLVCLGSIGLSVWWVWLPPEDKTLSLSRHYTVQKDLNDARLLVLPAMVSGFNLLLPGVFNFCAWLENYSSPSTHVYVSIFRNLLLKMSIVGVLCYDWLYKIPKEQVPCWENFVGQEVYRLLLMDFIFTVLYTFLGEFLWRLFSKQILKKDRKPVFDIARNVLELIYGQTLTWLGVLFAPLLPVVQIIKLFVLFYMKKASLMHNCQASKKPWRATQMTTLFITLLWFPSFLGAAVTFVYTVWMIKPSETCGPFRNLNKMFESGSWDERQKKSNAVLFFLSRAYGHLTENPLFLFLPSGVFLLVIYFHAQVVDGQREIISRLEKQIENPSSNVEESHWDFPVQTKARIKSSSSHNFSIFMNKDRKAALPTRT